MRRCFILVVLLAALVGCTTYTRTTPTQRTTSTAPKIRTLDDGLEALIGKDITVAFDALGYPDSGVEFNGGTIYLWSNSSTSTRLEFDPSKPLAPPPPTPPRADPQSAYNRTQLYSPFKEVEVHNQGKIKLVADSDGKIIDWEWSGDSKGLEPFRTKLLKYFRSRR